MNGDKDSDKGIDIDIIARISPTKKKFYVPVKLKNDLKALIIDSLVDSKEEGFFLLIISLLEA